MNSRLVLGTAQFGMPYGIHNRVGQVPETEVADILLCAREAGMDMLDTAVGYRESERVLGCVGVRDWRVVTKLPPLPDACSEAETWVRSVVEESIRRLGTTSLYGLLMHRSSDLRGKHGAAIYSELLALKDRGYVRKIGVSIYDPSELAALSGLKLDLVQAPFNVIDRRLDSSGWLSRLRDANIEVHARSIFLQGLLLMPRDERPAFFSRWNSLWDKWDSWLQVSGISALQGALAFVMDRDDLDGIVVGLDSKRQLLEILAAARGAAPKAPAELSSVDIDLINPSRWGTS